MAELLVSPDVVDLVVALLRSELPNIADQAAVPVGRSVPNPRPAAFITVRQLGGPGRDSAVPVVDRVSLTVEAWAAGAFQAHDLAQNARAVVHAAQGTALGSVQVYRVNEAGAPVDLPDPLSTQTRFTFSAELTVRIRRLT